MNDYWLLLSSIHHPSQLNISVIILMLRVGNLNYYSIRFFSALMPVNPVPSEYRRKNWWYVFIIRIRFTEIGEGEWTHVEDLTFAGGHTHKRWSRYISLPHPSILMHLCHAPRRAIPYRWPSQRCGITNANQNQTTGFFEEASVRRAVDPVPFPSSSSQVQHK